MSYKNFIKAVHHSINSHSCNFNINSDMLSTGMNTISLNNSNSNYNKGSNLRVKFKNFSSTSNNTLNLVNSVSVNYHDPDKDNTRLFNKGKSQLNTIIQRSELELDNDTYLKDKDKKRKSLQKKSKTGLINSNTNISNYNNHNYQSSNGSNYNILAFNVPGDADRAKIDFAKKGKQYSDASIPLFSKHVSNLNSINTTRTSSKINFTKFQSNKVLNQSILSKQSNKESFYSKRTEESFLKPDKDNKNEYNSNNKYKLSIITAKSSIVDNSKYINTVSIINNNNTKSDLESGTSRIREREYYNNFVNKNSKSNKKFHTTANTPTKRQNKTYLNSNNEKTNPIVNGGVYHFEKKRKEPFYKNCLAIERAVDNLSKNTINLDQFKSVLSHNSVCVEDIIVRLLN